MMLSLHTTKKYRKDRNTRKKRGYNIELIDDVI